MKRLAVALCAWLLVGCGAEAVVRVMDGDTVVGRFIDERAYDAYLRGAILEQDGLLDEAEAAYQQAYEADPEGVAPLVRLGAVRCARGKPDSHKRAEEAFSAAERQQPEYALLFVERARCLLAQHNAKAAEPQLQRALKFDPKDSETTVLYSHALVAMGKPAEAARLLVGYVTWRPQTPEVWRELEALAQRHPALIGPVFIPQGATRSNPSRASQGAHKESVAAIDQALAVGDLSAAQNAAMRASLRSSAVAVRAAGLGLWQHALAQAVLILKADPWDPDARAVLLSLPDLEQARLRLGAEEWTQMLGRATHPSRPSPLAALVLAEALKRRVGDEAATAFLRSFGEIAPQPSDPVHEALRQRVVH